MNGMQTAHIRESRTMLGLVNNESREHQEAPKLNVGYDAGKTFVVYKIAIAPWEISAR
jgi:hypothetical protein